MAPPDRRRVDVAPERLARWVSGFVERHGTVTAASEPGGLLLRAADGSTAVLRPLLPWRPSPVPADAADADRLVAEVVEQARQAPPLLVLLLVRRGGYAVGVVRDGRLAASKVGSRYVQSRTAAGGWSQQRFARRRDNQAAALLDATAAVAVRLALGDDGRTAPAGTVVVTGGDRTLVDQLLEDPRLAALAAARAERHLDVPDPRAEVLRQAVGRALAVQVDVVNT